MTRLAAIRTIVIGAVVLALAGLGMVVVILASRSTGSAMSGMDHGSGDTAMSSPTPTTSADAHGDMPGMDMPGEDAHGTTPGHDTMAEEAAPVRPIVPVLSTFGGGTSAVLLGAGLLRRKDRLRNQAKTAARAARRSAK